MPEGAVFASRKEAAAAGVHPPRQAGISGSSVEGADSIVVSGGYQDDRDFGDEIVYTGHGGNRAGVQLADQKLTRQNLALAISADQGLPIRVVRGAHGDPTHSPASGYRYDGLYFVDDYWSEDGIAGFRVYRFRLLKSPIEPSTAATPLPPPDGALSLGYTTTQRRIRNTAVSQWVKDLYKHRCQICGTRLNTAAGPYSEGAHIRPMGEPHHGPDVASNVVCLCPNDHVRFDRGALIIDPSGTIQSIPANAVLGDLRVDDRHELDFSQFEYHRSIHAPA